MRARRSTRLFLAPLVLLVLVLVPLATSGAPRAVVFCAIFGIYWLVSSLGDYPKQLLISDEELQMRGYVGGPVTVRRAEAVSCIFVRYGARERGAELFFLEVRDVHGTRLKIWRYGWGLKGKSLFRSLQLWLRDSPAEVSPDALRFLKRMAAQRKP